MNLNEWLRTVQAETTETPNSPRGTAELPLKKGPFPLSPPVTPCSPESTLNGERYFGEEENSPMERQESGTTGGLRGLQGVYRGIEPDGAGQDQTSDHDEPDPVRPRMPFFTEDGTLSIPFDSDPKYHWWKGGQSVKETIAEVRAKSAAAESTENPF